MYTITIIAFLIAIVILINKQFRAKNPSFSLEKTKLLKALLPFFIILHHCSSIFGGMSDFKNGAFILAIFFFISGYGLQVKVESNVFNLKYIIRRIVKLLTPIIIPAVIFALLLYYIDKEQFIAFYTNFKSWNILLPFTWFISKLIVLYFLFYVATYAAKLKIDSVIVLLTLVILVDLLLIKTSTGSHIYISDLAFVIGVMFRKIECRIMPSTILLSILCLAGALFLIPFLSKGIVYIIVITLLSSAIPMLLCNLNIKTSSVIKHLSSISYELYLCQGIAFLVLQQYSVSLLSSYILTFGITYILAVVSHKITVFLFEK